MKQKPKIRIYTDGKIFLIKRKLLWWWVDAGPLVIGKFPFRFEPVFASSMKEAWELADKLRGLKATHWRWCPDDAVSREREMHRVWNNPDKFQYR